MTIKDYWAAIYGCIICFLTCAGLTGCGVVTNGIDGLKAKFTPSVAGQGSTKTPVVASVTPVLPKWPVDAAVIPPPTIFLATETNCQPSAAIPVAAAADVAVVPGSENKFSVDVSRVDQIGAKQDSPTLCWAACTQTLLRQQNIKVEQAALAKEFVPDDDGDQEDQSAGLGVVIRALNPDLEPRLEQCDALPIDLLSITSDQLLTELMAGRLCIVGLVEQQGDGEGHACVVCGATFATLKPTTLAMLHVTVAINPNVPSHTPDTLNSGLSPMYGLYQVTLFDPWTGTRRTLSAQEFCDQAVFITSRKLARDTLLAALQPAPYGTVSRESKKHLVVKSKKKSDRDRTLALASKGKPQLVREKSSPDASKAEKKNKKEQAQ